MGPCLIYVQLEEIGGVSCGRFLLALQVLYVAIQERTEGTGRGVLFGLGSGSSRRFPFSAGPCFNMLDIRTEITPTILI